MPIVTVEVVQDSPISDHWALELAQAVGRALASRPGGTWVRLRRLPSARYAEDGPPGEHRRPVFVSVLQARAPVGEARAVAAVEVAEAVAGVCDRPRHSVHVIFEPDGTGRVAFGGELLSD